MRSKITLLSRRWYLSLSKWIATETWWTVKTKLPWARNSHLLKSKKRQEARKEVDVPQLEVRKSRPSTRRSSHLATSVNNSFVFSSRGRTSCLLKRLQSRSPMVKSLMRNFWRLKSDDCTISPTCFSPLVSSTKRRCLIAVSQPSNG